MTATSSSLNADASRVPLAVRTHAAAHWRPCRYNPRPARRSRPRESRFRTTSVRRMQGATNKRKPPEGGYSREEDGKPFRCTRGDVQGAG